MNKLLDKSETRIRKMFDEIAPGYDFLNHLLSANIDHYWRRETTRMVPPIGDGPILDVCTGTGDLAFAYLRCAQTPCQVTGSDFSNEMLLRAREKALIRGVGEELQFVQADTQSLPFASDTFQIVAVAFGLRNVTSTDRGLAEMVRVARPGGRVAILEFSKPRNWLMERIYTMYFRFLLPLVGQFFSRSGENAYRYLPASVGEFPDGEQLAEKMREHGLLEVTFHPLTFGIATLYVGTKAKKE